MEIYVTQAFIQHRAEKFDLYNRRGRTDKKFLMDIDCELYEFNKLKHDEDTVDHPSWMVDYTENGRNIDVKFIQKYWNVSGSKITNVLQQRRILDGYQFMEWVSRPSRPLEFGDRVEVRRLGFLSYDDVADNLRPSFKAQGQFYLDARRLLRLHGKNE